MQSSNTVRIFAVEDDTSYGKFLSYVLGLNPDFEIKLYNSGKECLDNLHLKPQIITLDYSLPDMTGEDVLRQIREFDPSIHVIIISGQEDISTAIDLLKLGAYDYISKDEETKDHLLNSIRNARKNVVLVEEITKLKAEINEKYDFSKSILGTSEPMQKVFLLLEKAIKTNITVSIYGETGTGKELVAKAIHYNSYRKGSKFVAVNIAAIPTELLESELFGHEKGAFTGAAARRTGKFEEANGGTIFLDEIGEMDIGLQAKILRVLQEKEVTRIGSNKVIKVDPRIIVATHRNLGEEVQKGNFREDLYYRLLGLTIPLPPLHLRGKDIIILGAKFLSSFCKENNLGNLLLSMDAKEKLLSYTYPGNVRELKSIVELAAVMSNGNEVLASDITFKSIKEEDNLTFEELTLKEYEFNIIKHFMKKYNNNVLKVADVLKIGKSTIYRHLKEINTHDN